jgi:hypothetical protein
MLAILMNCNELLYICPDNSGTEFSLNQYNESVILLYIFNPTLADLLGHECCRPTHFLPNVTQKTDPLFPSNNMCTDMHG